MNIIWKPIHDKQTFIAILGPQTWAQISVEIDEESEIGVVTTLHSLTSEEEKCFFVADKPDQIEALILKSKEYIDAISEAFYTH